MNLLKKTILTMSIMFNTQLVYAAEFSHGDDMSRFKPVILHAKKPASVKPLKKEENKFFPLTRSHKAILNSPIKESVAESKKQAIGLSKKNGMSQEQAQQIISIFASAQ